MTHTHVASNIIDNFIFGPAIKDMRRFMIGADSQINRLAKVADMVNRPMTNFPPYNIIRTSETELQLELAIAGFDPSEIDIEVKDSKLTITGKVSSGTNIDNEDDDDHNNGENGDRPEYLFRGIAKRSFSRSFVLDDNIEVHNAEFLNGMLTIHLEHIVPENLKPRKIEIKRVDGPKLLTEG